MEMYKAIEEKTSEDEDFSAIASVPLYRLGIGISPSSEGIPCASSAGTSKK